MRFRLQVLAAAALCIMSPVASAQTIYVGSSSLETISRSDLDRIPPGCSFLLHDSARRIIAISTDILEKDVSFWFKRGGKLEQVRGLATKTSDPGHISAWTAKFGETDVIIQKGRSAGNRNLRGEDTLHHGKATFESTGRGGMTQELRWEAGC